MNKNLERYFEAVGLASVASPRTFLQKWQSLNYRMVAHYLKRMGDLEAKTAWMDKHKVTMRFITFPDSVNTWLCCGKLRVDRIHGGRTWNEDYHMMTKLCCYETRDTVRITGWDRIRFWLITGYRFEDAG